MHHRLRRPDAQLSADLITQSRSEPEPERDPWRSVRPEGWTMPEMRRVARLGSARIRRAASGLVGDAIDIAWEGVALAVTLDPHCSWADAAEAAYRAVAGEAAELQHLRRLPQSDRHTGTRSAVYWGDWLDNQPPAPDGFLESVAFRQVWEALTTDQQQLLLMSTVMQQAEMAGHLGISVARVSQRLSAARRAAIALWHDWEAPPSRLPRHRVPAEPLDTCPRGHQLTSKRQAGGWIHRHCSTCDAARYRESVS